MGEHANSTPSVLQAIVRHCTNPHNKGPERTLRDRKRHPGNRKQEQKLLYLFLNLLALCVCCGGVTPEKNSRTCDSKDKTSAPVTPPTPATSTSTNSDVKTPPSPLQVSQSEDCDLNDGCDSNKQAEPTVIQPNDSSCKNLWKSHKPTPVTDPVSAVHEDPEKGHTTPVEQFPGPVSPEAPRANERPPTTKWADVPVKKPIRPVTAPPPTIKPFKILPMQQLVLVGEEIPAPGLIGLPVVRSTKRPSSRPPRLQDTGPSAKIDWQLPGVPIPSPTSWQEDGEEDADSEKVNMVSSSQTQEELRVSQKSLSSTDSSEEGSYVLWADVNSEETEL
ncbi:proteoglycan 4-like isoform X1 [Lepisosteus oculatus]|uniref:proteoglycan 4-like isoform X1 n=1 Tax=Lepisosteus oculatus TaxID=7918 RepID=UPI0035F500D7